MNVRPVLAAALAATAFLASPPAALAHPHDPPSDAAAACACADEDEAHSEEPSYILSLSFLPRVDGWDPTFGHRSGWGLAGGIDLSPWEAATEIHLEVTYLSNREESLISFDLGLKVPFHRGTDWDVHGVVGPALAYEHFRTTAASEGVVREGSLVVGMILGAGLAYWFRPHVGATLDLNYRILGGEEIAHRLFVAVGLAARW